MALPTPPPLTAEQYLAQERAATEKHEFLGGQVFAMAGASLRHNRLAANLIAALGLQLRGTPCGTYTSDTRVKVPATSLYTYPDVVVVCGQPEVEDAHQDTLLNPTLLIEVLSESTAAYDRGAKFEHYRQIPSLREYLLVSQDAARIERRVREGDTWIETEYAGRDVVLSLASVPARLSLAEVYDRVELS